jgi:hypothetical protein
MKRLRQLASELIVVIFVSPPQEAKPRSLKPLKVSKVSGRAEALDHLLQV